MKTICSKLACTLILAGAAITGTGCMMTPGHGEYVGLKTDPVKFTGAVQQPNKTVNIQARDRNNNGNWRTIGSARSGTLAVQYSGVNWYYWHYEKALDHNYWYAVSPFDWYAEVRAVDAASGQALNTWEDGFFAYFDMNEPLADHWEDHGHGTSVTIYAGVP